MANAGGIEHPHRAIPLPSTVLRVERVISRTTQRSIWEQSEIGSGKSFGEGSACPLRRPIADRLTRLRRLTRLHWLIPLPWLPRLHWLIPLRPLIHLRTDEFLHPPYRIQLLLPH